jgi:hypothetical protein
MVQTYGQQVTQEVGEGILPSGEKRETERFGWTNVMQERKMPGRNTLEGQKRMEFEGRNKLFQHASLHF